MTTKEKAREWNCTPKWVAEQCCRGMIPLSEKKARGWDIDEEAEKPPCSRAYAADLLQRISDSENGISVEFFGKKKTETDLIVYQYLSKWNYISKIAFSSKEECENKLVHAQVTVRGSDLLKRHNTSVAQQPKKNFKFNGSAIVNNQQGLVGIGVGVGFEVTDTSNSVTA
jgi:hypothetical protein